MTKQLEVYERNIIYNDLINKLDNIKLLNLPDKGIKKLLVMAKLFRDHAMEFNGEIELPLEMKITYEFYKDHRRQTIINISRNAHDLVDYYNKIDSHEFTENSLDEEL